MNLLYVVIFISTLSKESGSSNTCDRTEKCLIFQHGSNIAWPIGDIVKSVSSGYIFNATCGCTTGIPIWDVFNGSNNWVSCADTERYDIKHKYTYVSCDISSTIIESTVFLCHNDCHQYSKPVFINVTQKVPTCPQSSLLLSSSLFSGSPSDFYPQSLPSQFLSLSSPSPSITSDVITSLTTTTLSSHSNSIITITTVYSTVIVTSTPICSIKAETTTTTLSNNSLSTNPFIISTDQQTTLANKCTTTLLAVTIPFGGTVILIILLVTAIIFCIIVKKYSCAKTKKTTVLQNINTH